MSALSNITDFLVLPTYPENLKQAQRLFHGRGQGFEGLNHVSIDWLPPVLLITLFKPEEQADIKQLADQLLKLIPACTSVQLQRRDLLSGPVTLLRGEKLDQVVIHEQDLKFHIRLGRARNTGLFLDMRNGRQWLQQHSDQRRVLNLFAYTCAFSVAAIAGHARSVLNVDMSSAALSMGRQNHLLNSQSLSNVRFEKLDIFKSFGRLKKRGPFDILICDPPTFQKGSVDIARDYPKILRRLDEFMAPGASLLLCLNAPHLSSEFIIEHMQSLAPDYKFIEEIKPPKVFHDVQNRGLKVLHYMHC